MDFVNLKFCSKVGESDKAIQFCMMGDVLGGCIDDDKEIKFWLPKSVVKIDDDAFLAPKYFWAEKVKELLNIYGCIELNGFIKSSVKENSIGIMFQVSEHMSEQLVTRWVWFPKNQVINYVPDAEESIILVKRWLWEDKKNDVLASLPVQFRRFAKINVEEKLSRNW